MTMATKVQIIADINSHLQKSKKQYYSDFYIGITNDIERRLFEEHKVSKDYGWWIYRNGDTKAVAQAVEEYYLDKGMQGIRVAEMKIPHMYIAMKLPIIQ